MTDGKTVVARLVENEVRRRNDGYGIGKYIPGPIERRENKRAEVINTKISFRENMERNWKLYYMSD